MDRFKKYKIKIPIYTGDLLIYFSDDLGKVAEDIGGIEQEEIKKYKAFTHYKRVKDTDFYYLAFPMDPTVGDVVHEAKHIVNYIFREHGVRLDVNNDEHECYFLEWVVNQVYDGIDRNSKIR